MTEYDNERCKELVDKLRLGNFIENTISQPTMDNKTKSEIVPKFVDETSTDIFELKVQEYSKFNTMY
ncbi:unnamed protein product [Adineta steineri]|uniref:Uncharacterized protein n=1 Tax=Adineta steineri TaxID=433720 RepID=A0A815QCH6_9BILA|nr:unnamed protein product [Adineta steineri]CAF1633316.1 unnamed protein product [Adineta steineri]